VVVLAACVMDTPAVCLVGFSFKMNDNSAIKSHNGGTSSNPKLKDTAK